LSLLEGVETCFAKEQQHACNSGQQEKWRKDYPYRSMQLPEEHKQSLSQRAPAEANSPNDEDARAAFQ